MDSTIKNSKSQILDAYMLHVNSYTILVGGGCHEMRCFFTEK